MSPLPVSMRDSPHSMRIRVDFPEPEAPNSATHSPDAIENDTLSSALKWLCCPFDSAGNVLETFCAAIIWAAPSGSVEDVEFIDSTVKSDYYKSMNRENYFVPYLNCNEGVCYFLLLGGPTIRPVNDL